MAEDTNDDRGGVGTLTTRIILSAERVVVAPRLPWALATLHALLMAVWLRLCLWSGPALASVIVFVPWSVVAWRRAWRHAERPSVDTIARALVVTAPVAGGGYREGEAPPTCTLDGRPLDPSTLGGVVVLEDPARVVGTRARHRRVPSEHATVYLRVRERPLRVLRAPHALAREVADALGQRLRLGKPVHGVAPMPSMYYGGWRVLGACFALYLACTMPLGGVFFTFDEVPDPPPLALALRGLAWFLLTDQVAVRLWGWIFRAPRRAWAADALRSDA